MGDTNLEIQQGVVYVNPNGAAPSDVELDAMAREVQQAFNKESGGVGPSLSEVKDVLMKYVEAAKLEGRSSSMTVRRFATEMARVSTEITVPDLEPPVPVRIEAQRNDEIKWLKPGFLIAMLQVLQEIIQVSKQVKEAEKKVELQAIEQIQVNADTKKAAQMDGAKTKQRKHLAQMGASIAQATVSAGSGLVRLKSLGSKVETDKTKKLEGQLKEKTAEVANLKAKQADLQAKIKDFKETGIKPHDGLAIAPDEADFAAVEKPMLKDSPEYATQEKAMNKELESLQRDIRIAQREESRIANRLEDAETEAIRDRQGLLETVPRTVDSIAQAVRSGTEATAAVEEAHHENVITQVSANEQKNQIILQAAQKSTSAMNESIAKSVQDFDKMSRDQTTRNRWSNSQTA